uniref:Uncharacterized protein n=1 Tax=Arundo donax TaxID=35708 RepID=A0A0A9HTW3_ARUDO
MRRACFFLSRRHNALAAPCLEPSCWSFRNRVSCPGVPVHRCYPRRSISSCLQLNRRSCNWQGLGPVHPPDLQSQFVRLFCTVYQVPACKSS